MKIFYQIISAIVKYEKPIIMGVAIFIKDFFLVGSFWQLWYFVGLITGVWILYALVNIIKLPNRAILMLCIVLYSIGTLGNAYANVFIDVPLINSIAKIYTAIFNTTRNGLFFGLPYIFAGYLIKRHEKSSSSLKYYFLFFVSLFFMFVEGFAVNAYLQPLGVDMYFTAVPTTVFLFLALLNTNINIKYLKLGIAVRNFSTLVFGWHVFINFYFGFLLRKNVFGETNSIIYWIFINAITICMCLFILHLSKKEKFSFLMSLY